ncbi:TPA: hypothetical protein PBK94_002364 [Staphylococcus aureus]|nr:hypothetical protein [Staphylococcus aureus]HAR3582714.1 hypothetical protein [Staphylococcus aureus]HBE7287853.1 hypothetical protein [Staphylococcus aureus]HBE7288186.1 hypothetical protein [Staphylococcus aureus]HCV5655412.1 hypothetical protein [Staphylococcus aureus]
MRFTPRGILNNTDYELNSELYYVPASDKQMNDQRDMTNKSIVGNLVYRNNFYNEVYTQPVYDLDDSNEKYQTPHIMSIDDSEFDYNLTNLDDYFTKDTANKGYEKLVNAIKSEEITYFDSDINEVDDFTQQDEYSNDWYTNTFVDLVLSMKGYSYHVEPNREPVIEDSHIITENDITYNVNYNPEKHHLYINDFPAIPIEENDNIRLLNDNLTQDMEKTYDNIDYKFSYNDFKTLEDDSYIYIDLTDYKDNEGKFVKNLIEDIPPNEIIKDRLKQNINLFDERANYNALAVYRRDLEDFSDRNNLDSLDKVKDLKTFYDTEINIKGLNINNDIEKKALNNQLAFNLYNEPLNNMFRDNNVLYEVYEKEIYDEKIPLSIEDRKEVKTYLDDARNNFSNNFYEYTTNKSSILAENSLTVLDKAKYDLEFAPVSNHLYKERENFYEGMKQATLPLHNITKEQYKERENDIEIIGHFKNYINTELHGTKSSEFKPNFVNDSLENETNSISFEDIINGSEETHSNIINSIKNELKQERDNLEM